MTSEDVRAVAVGLGKPNVVVVLIRRGGEQWHISWGTGLTRTAVLVPVEGCTPEAVQAAIEAAQ